MLPERTDADTFYRKLTKRNAGLIAPATQRRLREARIVVAGCGSTGGAAVMPLVRSGATRFLLADPDAFELSNLNRQNATIYDIGDNKAVVAARNVRSVNPHASIEILEDGIPTHGVDALLDDDDVVIDAIDVTTAAGIAAKKALHVAAARKRLPVITAYDIAACQFVEVFDYRTGGRALGGKVDGKETPEEVLAALIPPTALPEEILPIIARGAAVLDTGFPQLAMTAQLFGALVVPVVLRLLDNEPTAGRIRIDLFAATTPRHRRPMRRIRTLAKLPSVWRTTRRRTQ